MYVMGHDGFDKLIVIEIVKGTIIWLPVRAGSRVIEKVVEYDHCAILPIIAEIGTAPQVTLEIEVALLRNVPCVDNSRRICRTEY